MKNLIRKICLLGLVTLMPLASCGKGSDDTGDNGGGQEGGTKIINVWVHKNKEEKEGKVYNSIVEAFNKANVTTSTGTKVRMSMQFYGSTLSTKISAAQLTGGLPDIFALDSTDVSSYVKNKLLQSIDNYITTDEKADYVNSVIDQGVINNKLYALSAMEAPGGLYYNTELLKSVGYKDEDFATQWSWKDVKEALVKLNNAGKAHQINLNTGFGTDGYMYFYSSLVYSAGGNFGEDGKVESALTSDKSVAGLKQLEQFYDKTGLGSNDSWVYTGSSETAFQTGQLPFEIHGPWEARTIEKDNTAVKGKYGIMGMPVYEDESGNKSTLISNPCGSYCFGVSKDAKNLEAATLALKYLTNKDSSEALFNEIGTFPTHNSSFTDSSTFQTGVYKSLKDNLTNNQFTRPKQVKYPQLKQAYGTVIEYIKLNYGKSNYDLKGEISTRMKTVDSARG